MKDFIDELKYMCTSSNARGFYIFVTVALIALIIGCIASLVMMLVNVIKFHAFSFFWLGLLIVTLILTIGVIVWLKKS